MQKKDLRKVERSNPGDAYLHRVPKVITGSAQRRAAAQSAALVFERVARRHGRAAAEAAVKKHFEQLEEDVAAHDNFGVQ